MTTTTLRRGIGASVALAATLTLSGPLVAGASADPAPASSTESAAHYLQQELIAGGSHFSVESDWGPYVDYGVTADAVLALASAGTGQAESRKATAFLADKVLTYTGFDDPNEVYAGATAKLLNVAVAQGLDPRDFGGNDLVAMLTALEAESGRFSDQTAYDDYSNVLGQSLALIGLKRAGVNPSTASVEFLAGQQCPGGGFRLSMDASPCTDGATSDPDATAFAVQALIATSGDRESIEGGLDYLAARQGADGGVGGGGPQTAPNANSTGLAGQAFLAGGRSAQATLARQYIADLQYGCQFPEALRGGIAYNAEAFADQLAAGADAVPVDQDRRSTAQAILALAGTPLYAVTATGAADTATAPECSEEPSEPSEPGEPTPPVTGPVIETDIPTPHVGARGLLR